eukprot:COSAG01_NODE_1853_length_9060_cov_13.741576_5_plen_103_part_00
MPPSPGRDGGVSRFLDQTRRYIGNSQSNPAANKDATVATPPATSTGGSPSASAWWTKREKALDTRRSCHSSAGRSLRRERDDARRFFVSGAERSRRLPGRGF